MNVNTGRDIPKRVAHSTKKGPGRRHVDGTKKTNGSKSRSAATKAAP